MDDLRNNRETDSLIDLLHMEENNENIAHQPTQYDDIDNFSTQLKKNSKKLSILSLNCQSIEAKFVAINMLVQQLVEKNCYFKIIVLQESWLENNSYDPIKYEIPDYNMVSQGHYVSAHGGLITYIHKSLNYEPIEFASKSKLWENQFIKIFDKNKQNKAIICNVYRRPDEIVENIDLFTNELSCVMKQLNKHKYKAFVCGDLNLNLLKIHTNQHYQSYFDEIVSRGFMPNITLPTRFNLNTGTATLIDNMFTNTDMKNNISVVLTNHISDHQPIGLITDHFMIVKKSVPKYITIRKNDDKSLQHFGESIAKKKIFQKMNKNLSQNPNENLEILTTILTDAKSKCLPSKKVKYKKKIHKKDPWMTDGLLIVSAKKDSMYAELIHTPAGTEIKATRQTNFDTYLKMFKRDCCKAKRKYYHNALNKHIGDMKRTWSVLNKILNRGNIHDEHITLNINGLHCSDPKEIAQHFNDYFANVGQTVFNTFDSQDVDSYKQYLQTPSDTDFQIAMTTEDKTLGIINKLKNTNTAGHDGISNRMIKHVRHNISAALTLIVNQTISTGIFPDSLKIARIKPLFKKGDKQLITNYRPISILSSLSKIFERTLFDQLSHFLEGTHQMNEHQYGYRKNHSTEWASMELVDRVVTDIDKHYIPFNVYIDLTKAFDSISYDILYYKLACYGIRGDALKLLVNYLTDRSQYVEIDGALSDKSKLSIGVPQGSILGPLLFNIYINDLHKSSNKFNFINYADDTTLNSTLEAFGDRKNVPQIQNNINRELTKVNTWLFRNKLLINSSKTKLMLFYTYQRTSYIPKITLSINETPIEMVEHFTFLGITFDTHLTWRYHINNVTSKMNPVISNLNSLKLLIPRQALVTIYNTLLLPHINFGLLTWGIENDRITLLQKRAIRNITNSNFRGHADPGFIALNTLKVEDMYTLRLFKLYYQLMNKQFPSYFNKFKGLIVNVNNSGYYLRPKPPPTPLIALTFAEKKTSYNLIKSIHSLPINIAVKIQTHGEKYLSNNLKEHLLDNYEAVCVIPNCYTCSLN